MPRELSKCRNWEKERRNRLNEGFKKLEIVLPCYEPSKSLSKPDILKKAAECITELKGKVEKCLTADPEKKTEHEEIKQLYASVKQLINRNDQLSKLLKDAGIPIPPANFNFKTTCPKLWSNVISTQKAAILAKLEEQKENEPRKLVKRKCIPKKKVPPKKQFVKPKIKKSRKKVNGVGGAVQNNLRPIVISGTNFNPVQNLMAVPTVQPCFFIANNVSEASTKANVTNAVSTVLSNSNMIATPILSSAANTPIVFSKPTTFPTGTIILANNLPVIQPPTLIPPPIILNAPPANTVILVNKPKEVSVCNKDPEPPSVTKTTAGSRPLQRICKKISNTTTTHINKVPIPASRYANDYILVSKVQVAKTEVRKVKKVVKKIAVKRKNVEVVKCDTVVKKAKIVEEKEKVAESEESKKGSSDYSIDAICKDKPDESVVKEKIQTENETAKNYDKEVIEEKSEEKINDDNLKTDEVVEKPTKPIEMIPNDALVHSELSNDIFASLQVQTGGQNPESTSPTAAFLNAFPLVSSFTGVKVAEVMEEETCDSQQGTPTLLQIGTMDTAKPTHSLTDTLTPSLLNLDNFSFFSSKELYNAFDAVASEVTKVATSKEINVISKTARILYDTAVSETNNPIMSKLSGSMITGMSESNYDTLPKIPASMISSIPDENHQALAKIATTISQVNNDILPKISSSMITESNQLLSKLSTTISDSKNEITPQVSTSTITTVSTKTVISSDINSSTVIQHNRVPVQIIDDVTLKPQKTNSKMSSATDGLFSQISGTNDVSASRTVVPEKLFTSESMLSSVQKSVPNIMKQCEPLNWAPTSIPMTTSQKSVATVNMPLSLASLEVSKSIITTAPTVVANMTSCLPNLVSTVETSSNLVTTVSAVISNTLAMNPQKVTVPTIESNMPLSLPSKVIPQNPTSTIANNVSTTMLPQTLVTTIFNNTPLPLTTMISQHAVNTFPTFTNNMSLPLTTMVTQKLITTGPIFTNNMSLPLSTPMVSQNLPVSTFTNNISLPLTTMEQGKVVSTGSIFTNMSLPLTSTVISQNLVTTVPTITHNMLGQDVVTTVSSVMSTTAVSQKLVTTLTTQAPSITYSVNNSYTPFYNKNNNVEVFTSANHIPSNINYMEDKNKLEKSACSRYTSYNISEYNTFNPFTDLPKTSAVCTYTTTKTYTQSTYTNNTNCSYNYQTEFNTNYPAKNVGKNTQLHYNMNYESYDNVNQYNYYGVQLNKSNSNKVKVNETTPRPPVNWMTTPDLKNLPTTDFKHQTPADFKHQPVADFKNQTSSDFKHQPIADFKNQSTVDFKHQAAATDFKHQTATDFKHQTATDFKHQTPTEFKHQSATEFKHQSATDFKHQGVTEFKQQTASDFKHQAAATDFKHQAMADFKHQSVTDFKHQAATEFKHAPVTEFKHQTAADFKHQAPTDFKHQSVTDFKHQPATDFKHHSTTHFKHQSAADFKHQPIGDFKHQSATDFLVPTFGKEPEFVANIYTQNNFASNVQTTYFNTTAPIYSTPEFHNNFEGKKLETQFNNTFQRNDVEEHQFSWSPTKLPQLLDPAHSFVTTTLPTLVGDLALGNTQYNDKNKGKKDNRRGSQQNYDTSTNSNFLSVSQLVDHNKSESTARITSRRNSGGRSKATTPKNTKNRNKGENKEAIMSPTYKPPEKNVFNNTNNTNTIQTNQTSGEWIGNEVKRAKQPPSSYSAEALIAQNQAKQRPQTQNYSKTLPVPTFFSENMLYFPPMEIQQDNNFAQQNQNYQNHSFPATNSYSAPYLPSTNFIPEITDYNPVIPDNIFSHANTAKIPENKQFNKTLDFNKAPANKSAATNKSIFHNNTTPKKSKKKPTVETSTPGFVDFSFLSMPGTINSPILPDDFHAHSNFLPPPNPNQLYPCKNPLYPKQGGDLSGSLLPLPPVSRANMQHTEMCPSINNTVGTSLTNFNLSTIFPEINKSTVSEMYLDPTKNKDYGLQRTYLPTSSQLPSFSKAPIYSTIKTQTFTNN